jgi:hypothetical protein
MNTDKLTLGVGLAQEIEHALNRNGFTSLDQVKALTVGDFLGRVRGVQMGLYEIKPVEHAIDFGATPLVPEGWSVEEHKKGKVAKLERRGDELYLDGKKIELWLSKPQKKGNVIGGNDLRKEVSKRSVINANLPEYLLKNPHLIPDAWKKDEKGNTIYIFFWGTVCRFSDGRLDVRYLYWDGGKWTMYYGWLDGVWDSRGPAAVLAS